MFRIETLSLQQHKQTSWHTPFASSHDHFKVASSESNLRKLTTCSVIPQAFAEFSFQVPKKFDSF